MKARMDSKKKVWWRRKANGIKVIVYSLYAFYYLPVSYFFRINMPFLIYMRVIILFTPIDSDILMFYTRWNIWWDDKQWLKITAFNWHFLIFTVSFSLMRMRACQLLSLTMSIHSLTMTSRSLPLQNLHYSQLNPLRQRTLFTHGAFLGTQPDSHCWKWREKYLLGRSGR